MPHGGALVLLVEHFGPGIAQFSEEAFDLDDRRNVLAQVGLEKAAMMIVVQTKHGLSELPAHSHVQAALQLDDNSLRLEQLSVDILDATRLGDRLLEGLLGQ